MKVVYTLNGQGKSITFDGVECEARGRNAFSASLLESAIRAILKSNGVSANVYNNRPKAVSPQTNDFIVVNVQGEIDDMASFGTCTLDVALFAKDAAGFKNGKKLTLMQGAVMDKLPCALKVQTDGYDTVAEYEIDKYPSIVGDASDDYGFHARIILFDTTIKVI